MIKYRIDRGYSEVLFRGFYDTSVLVKLRDIGVFRYLVYSLPLEQHMPVIIKYLFERCIFFNSHIRIRFPYDILFYICSPVRFRILVINLRMHCFSEF